MSLPTDSAASLATASATEAAAPVAALPTASTCLNCGASLSNAWCAACGQKARTARLSLQHLVHELPHAVFHVDRGIVPTLRGLLTRPGQLVMDYLDGKRVRYFNPLTLLVICSALCGALWTLFPLRPELFWALVPQSDGVLVQKGVSLWFKLVGATQLLWLPLLAYVLHFSWRLSLYRTLSREGTLKGRTGRAYFEILAKEEKEVLRADPRYRYFGEAMAAAAFVTSISLLITAIFAPIFALAQTPEQYRALIVVAGVLSSLPPLHLLMTLPVALRSNWAEGISNAVLFAVGTPLGFLFHLLMHNWAGQFGAWLARLLK